MPIENVATRAPSPDGRWELVTHDLWEYRMGWYDAKVALVDAAGAVVETFAPLSAETSAAGVWSSDSAHLAFASKRDSSFYLVWTVANARFAIVRVGNPYPLDLRFAGIDAIEIAFRVDQLEALNSQETFGAGRAEFPVRKFKMGPPLRIAFANLRFRDRAELAEIDAFLDAEPTHDVGPEPDGFFPYDGPPLRSTSQRVNSRPLAGEHLEAFADWGDPVAQAWLAELRAKRGERYDPWEPVAKALGKRKR